MRSQRRTGAWASGEARAGRNTQPADVLITRRPGSRHATLLVYPKSRFAREAAAAATSGTATATSAARQRSSAQGARVERQCAGGPQVRRKVRSGWLGYPLVGHASADRASRSLMMGNAGSLPQHPMAEERP